MSTLIERASAFVSCPLSNLVLGGSRQIADLTVPYDGLDKWGVHRITGEAQSVDAAARTVTLVGGATLSTKYRKFERPAQRKAAQARHSVKSPHVSYRPD